MTDALSARGGVVRDVAVLDLTAATRPEELEHLRRIQDVAAVLVRESAAVALTRIEVADVASVVAIPDGGRAHVHTGSLVLGGDAFADERVKHDFLVVTGSLVVTTPVREVAYAGIVVTGSMIVPEGSEATLGSVVSRVTGSFSTFPLRDGERVVHRDGDVRLQGAALANPTGTHEDVLLVTGTLTVTGEVESMGFARVIVVGALLAPAAFRDILEPWVTASSTLWYTQAPKLLSGSQDVGRTFFQLLEGPAALAFLGSTRIDPDVTLDDVLPKVSEVFVTGSLHAPREVLALFQARGEISGSVEALDPAADA